MRRGSERRVGDLRVAAIAVVLALLPAALATGCAQPLPRAGSAAAAPSAGSSLLVVVSFDGYRWDYPELHGAPELLALAREGVRARALVPSFPSKTYPNHYTLATGLRPERHGVVANTMWDPLWQARFSLAARGAVEDGRWYEGEPIWVTAERAGLATASSYWPGRAAAIAGVRPRIWRRYDAEAPDFGRIDEVLGWLDRSAAERPRLLMVYLAEPDLSGHRFGPEAPETRLAVAHVDQVLARLRAGIAARGLGASTDWIVVSDHGMATVSPERTIVLEDRLDLGDVDLDDVNIVAGIRPRPGREAAVLAALAEASPPLHVARRDEMPERLSFRAHRRIAPVVAWVDPGWLLYATRADRDRALRNFSFGAHGYDPAAPEMHGVFVAAGPSFRKGVEVPPIDNVDLYELMCRLLALEPAPNDGDPATADALLAPHPEARAASRPLRE
jgi:predicted AlkP superfamily pyrophosphatase or phosphodiesterase